MQVDQVRSAFRLVLKLVCTHSDGDRQVSCNLLSVELLQNNIPEIKTYRLCCMGACSTPLYTTGMYLLELGKPVVIAVKNMQV